MDRCQARLRISMCCPLPPQTPRGQRNSLGAPEDTCTLLYTLFISSRLLLFPSHMAFFLNSDPELHDKASAGCAALEFYSESTNLRLGCNAEGHASRSTKGSMGLHLVARKVETTKKPTLIRKQLVTRTSNRTNVAPSLLCSTKPCENRLAGSREKDLKGL